MRMVTHYGGLDVHIPKAEQGNNYDHLVRIMGADIAAELVRVFGGERLYIAKNAKEAKQMHRRIIAERRAAGETWQQIASTYTFKTRFSERWVRKLGASDQPTQQGHRPQSVSAHHVDKRSLFDIPAPHHLNALYGKTDQDKQQAREMLKPPEYRN